MVEGAKIYVLGILIIPSKITNELLPSVEFPVLFGNNSHASNSIA